MAVVHTGRQAGYLRRATALGLLLCMAGLAARAEGTGSAADAIARQLVATALGVPVQSTRVVSRTLRDFPDTSLDCPAPGMAYAQVITPGQVLIVEAEGRRFDVRVAGNAGRICHRRKGGRMAAPPGPAPAELAESARQDLARRLGVDAAEIQVLNIRRLGAGEQVPGCGPVCSGDTATCGYGIRLLAEERAFDYVSAADHVRPCPDISSR